MNWAISILSILAFYGVITLIKQILDLPKLLKAQQKKEK